MYEKSSNVSVYSNFIETTNFLLSGFINTLILYAKNTSLDNFNLCIKEFIHGKIFFLFDISKVTIILTTNPKYFLKMSTSKDVLI